MANRSLPRTYHPAGYRAHPFHYALIFTDLLGRISPWALLPAWLALAAIACWPWPGGLRLYAALLTLGCILVEGIGLALLPRLRRSFGPVTPPLLALALSHTLLMVVVGKAWPAWPGLALAGGLSLAAVGAFLYATWVEPFRISVTHMRLQSPKLNGDRPLRVVHLSDLHIERRTRREERLLALVRALQPDLVVLTGDYLNLSYAQDPEAHVEARRLLSDLCASAAAPVYAITGSPPVDLPDVVPAIFQDLPITWLHDRVERFEKHGHVIQVAGLRCYRERAIDVPRLQQLLERREDGLFTLLLYHSPDLMPEAVQHKVDLYLCGHTHGGQIRLPLFGALVTSSAFWKRYEMGQYREGDTTLYVSRGVGLEGLGAPRARFLSPPEVVLWELSGPAD